MERSELEKRYQEAQFATMAQMAEHHPDQAEQQTDNGPAAPTLAQIMLKAAGIKPTPDTHITPEDHLRRWAGLK